MTWAPGVVDPNVGLEPSPSFPVWPRSSELRASRQYKFPDPAIRIACVGDLHGRIDLLEQLARRLDDFVNDDARRLVEVYVGDYVDHAGDAKSVIDFLLARQARTDRDVVCLRGNHEQMLLAALDGDKAFLRWLEFGGFPTMLAYGVAPADAKRSPAEARRRLREAIPSAHFQFLDGLKLMHRVDDFIFVHAGVRPGVPLDRQSTQDLLWIRDNFLNANDDFGAIVVHGHTPTARPALRRNRIGLDTGAYFSGRLTSVLLTSEETTVVTTG
jgi:serine/threonine protein phosphatase 1